MIIPILTGGTLGTLLTDKHWGIQLEERTSDPFFYSQSPLAMEISYNPEDPTRKAIRASLKRRGIDFHRDLWDELDGWKKIYEYLDRRGFIIHP